MLRCTIIHARDVQQSIVETTFRVGITAVLLRRCLRINDQLCLDMIFDANWYIPFFPVSFLEQPAVFLLKEHHCSLSNDSIAQSYISVFPHGSGNSGSIVSHFRSDAWGQAAFFTELPKENLFLEVEVAISMGCIHNLV
jgi:hypothetical protein